MQRKKISIIGAGNIGGTTAHQVIAGNLGDVVLYDVITGFPQGKALDIAQAAPLHDSDSRIIGTNRFDDTEGSDIVIICAGMPRKKGMSRSDLLNTNALVVKEITQAVAPRSPDAIVIVVTNPLDAMTALAYRVSEFPKERVMGMAGMLDSTRFRAFIADELDVSVSNIQAFVLGGHGDSMVPSTRYTTVAGVPVEALIPAERLELLVDRTRHAGSDIVALLETHSAYYAASVSLAQMCKAIVSDRKLVCACSVLCQGQYGIEDTFVGVPIKLGTQGIEEILEYDLSAAELAALQASAREVRDLCAKLQV
jgi:malate dehydrogenase